MVKKRSELALQYGIKVKEYRKKAKISQEKLAELCDCSTQTICGIETGYNSPSFNLMDAISKVLNIPLIYFFTFDTEIRLSEHEKEFIFNKQFSQLNAQDKDMILRIIASLNKD